MAMCSEIFNGGSAGRCNITSGGTESIYCAMLAMREWAIRTAPHDCPDAWTRTVRPSPYHLSLRAHYAELHLRATPTGMRSASTQLCCAEHLVRSSKGSQIWNSCGCK